MIKELLDYISLKVRKSLFVLLTPFLALVLPAISWAQPATTGGAQWGSFNNRLDGQRFSPLDEITINNAAEVGEVCQIRIDGATAFTAGLIEIDGVIYTNTGRQTVAIDATDCTLLWRHTYTPDDRELRQSSRGPAVLDGRVFRGTGDGRLFALDATTGELLWKNEIGSPRLSEFISGAPLAWQGMVFAGIGGGDAGIRGRIMAYDAATGRELWRFNTVPMGDEFGADTWERPASAKTGGGGFWGAMTLDVTTGELFVPVGNPWPDIDHGYRPGSNLFTNSIVVLDAQSGELKWWHQAVEADSHDYDLVAPPVLYRNQSIQDVMVFSGKDGYVTGIDRDSKNTIFRTAVTRIENEDVPATEDGTLICPGFGGATGWNGPALDQVNNLLMIGTRGGGCMKIFPAPTVYEPPGVSYGGRVEPEDSESWGAVTALDAETGEILWSQRTESAVIAGITPTAGGVTFTGDNNGQFVILESQTGQVLHEQYTGGAMAGGVITYEREGKQFIAVAAGNVSRMATGVTGFPSVVILALNPDTSNQSMIDAENIAAGEPNWAQGRGLYEQICSTCHGPNGDAFVDHTLSDITERYDLDEIISLIKEPSLPMPKMFPDILTEQDLVDLGAFLSRGI